MNTGVYQHYKGGFYQVIGVARHSETGERMVVYVSLTGAANYGLRMHVRPEAMFKELVEVGCDGDLTHVCGPGCERKVPRFEYVGDEMPKVPA